MTSLFLLKTRPQRDGCIAASCVKLSSLDNWSRSPPNVPIISNYQNDKNTPLQRRSRECGDVHMTFTWCPICSPGRCPDWRRASPRTPAKMHLKCKQNTEIKFNKKFSACLSPRRTPSSRPRDCPAPPHSSQSHSCQEIVFLVARATQATIEIAAMVTESVSEKVSHTFQRRPKCNNDVIMWIFKT